MLLCTTMQWWDFNTILADARDRSNYYNFIHFNKQDYSVVFTKILKSGPLKFSRPSFIRQAYLIWNFDAISPLNLFLNLEIQIILTSATYSVPGIFFYIFLRVCENFGGQLGEINAEASFRQLCIFSKFFRIELRIPKIVHKLQVSNL